MNPAQYKLAMLQRAQERQAMVTGGSGEDLDADESYLAHPASLRVVLPETHHGKTMDTANPKPGRPGRPPHLELEVGVVKQPLLALETEVDVNRLRKWGAEV